MIYTTYQCVKITSLSKLLIPGKPKIWINRLISSNAKSREIINFIKRTRSGANRSKDFVDVDLDLRAQLQKGKQLVGYKSSNDEFTD